MVEYSKAPKHTYLGAVGGKSKLLDVTLVVNTSAYADGDLLSDVVEIPNAFRGNGLTAILHSVKLSDVDDEGVEIDLFFTALSTSWGTINDAADPSDAVVEAIQAHVNIGTGDYVTFNDTQVAHVRNIGALLKAASDSTSLYVAAVVRGTPTYTAATDLKLKVGLLLD